MIIREVEYPVISDIIKNKNIKNKTKYELYLDKQFSLIGSGKAALSLILGYLRNTKFIPDKMYEVVVPGWLGYWVYNQIQEFAFPSRSLSSKTRIVLVYHQYGFPQNIDKIMDALSGSNVIIIEDCAHTLFSKYRNKLVGTIGDFSIYSFSKFLFCYALGGIRYKNKEFKIYLSKQLKKSSSLLVYFLNSTKLINDYSNKYPHLPIKQMANYLIRMSYSLYGVSFKYSKSSKKLFYNKLDNEIDIRIKRYKYFLEKTNKTGICDHLEQSEICPYIIPINVKKKHQDKVVTKLKNIGIQTGIYHFDMARFMFEPDFKPCIWVFCHSGITDNFFEKQIDIILDNL